MSQVDIITQPPNFAIYIASWVFSGIGLVKSILAMLGLWSEPSECRREAVMNHTRLIARNPRRSHHSRSSRHASANSSTTTLVEEDGLCKEILPQCEPKVFSPAPKLRTRLSQGRETFAVLISLSKRRPSLGRKDSAATLVELEVETKKTSSNPLNPALRRFSGGAKDFFLRKKSGEFSASQVCAVS